MSVGMEKCVILLKYPLEILYFPFKQLVKQDNGVHASLYLTATCSLKYAPWYYIRTRMDLPVTKFS